MKNLKKTKILTWMVFGVFLASYITFSLYYIDSNWINENEISFLALGDSYTIGESVSQNESWPFQLVMSLEKENLTVSNLEIFARTGRMSYELIQKIESADLDNSYDIISLLIGVNDQFRGKTLKSYRNHFTQLLEISTDLTKSAEKVVVISIPDYSVMPAFKDRLEKDLISSEIDEFNEINKELSLSFGVKYIDITNISREAEEDLTLVASDQLHPSGKMYEEWVRLIQPAFEEIIENHSLFKTLLKNYFLIIPIIASCITLVVLRNLLHPTSEKIKLTH